MGECGKPGFTKLSGDELRETLEFDLSDIIDEVRDIETELGQRPYNVRLIRVGYTSKNRREGEAFLLGDPIDILPPPRLTDLTGMQRVITPGGAEENGTLVLSEIPARFGEDVLVGLDSHGNPPAPNEQFFLEVEFPSLSGGNAKLRSFTPSSAANYDTNAHGWSLTIESRALPRLRDGAVR